MKDFEFAAAIFLAASCYFSAACNRQISCVVCGIAFVVTVWHIAFGGA